MCFILLVMLKSEDLFFVCLPVKIFVSGLLKRCTERLFYTEIPKIMVKKKKLKFHTNNESAK